MTFYIKVSLVNWKLLKTTVSVKKKSLAFKDLISSLTLSKILNNRWENTLLICFIKEFHKQNKRCFQTPAYHDKNPAKFGIIVYLMMSQIIALLLKSKITIISSMSRNIREKSFTTVFFQWKKLEHFLKLGFITYYSYLYSWKRLILISWSFLEELTEIYFLHAYEFS